MYPSTCIAIVIVCALQYVELISPLAYRQVPQNTVPYQGSTTDCLLHVIGRYSYLLHNRTVYYFVISIIYIFIATALLHSDGIDSDIYR
jgi:hypothetical protein